VETVIRFDMRAPKFGASTPRLYNTALEMAEYADRQGVDVLMLCEHHGSEDGYLPAPEVLAGGIAARTSQARIRIGAVVLPLHHPIAVAEQAAVLDQMSNGRAEIVAAAGYVPSEFAMFGRTLHDRARLLEEYLPILAQAMTGEPVTVDGHTFTVTPEPVQRPRPPLFIAGGVRATARRAALYGDGFYSLTDDPALFDCYREVCEAEGKPVGPMITAVGPLFVHIAEDPEKAWSVIGKHALHEMNAYGRWAAESSGGDLKSPYHEVADISAIRGAGLHQVLTVDECVDLLQKIEAENRSILLTPLMAGLDPDIAWPSLNLFFERVLPEFRSRGGTTGAYTYRPGVAPVRT
jgi:alkanesulfonate monooxygenase SsuD/methylene tetrahydromethanopterin reductase-like flavin-dependent oxidoreductase (luciferase family)